MKNAPIRDALISTFLFRNAMTTAPVALVIEKPRSSLYRVTRGVWFNQFGASQWLEVGTLIDESVVGAAHVAELKRHRIPLEEV